MCKVSANERNTKQILFVFIPECRLNLFKVSANERNTKQIYLFLFPNAALTYLKLVQMSGIQNKKKTIAPYRECSVAL